MHKNKRKKKFRPLCLTEGSSPLGKGTAFCLYLFIAGTFILLPGVLLLLVQPHFGYFIELISSALIGLGAASYFVVFGASTCFCIYESIEKREKLSLLESGIAIIVGLTLISSIPAFKFSERALVLIHDLGPAIHKEYDTVEGTIEIQGRNRHDVIFSIEGVYFKSLRFSIRDKIVHMVYTKVHYLPYSKYVIDITQLNP